MHFGKWMWITAMALLAAITIPVQVVHAQVPKQPSKYYVFNLGTAPFGGVPEPIGINNLGWISGGDNLASNTSVLFITPSTGAKEAKDHFTRHKKAGERYGISLGLSSA